MNEAKQHSMFEYLFHPIEFDLDRDHKIVELTELSYFLLINQIEKERDDHIDKHQKNIYFHILMLRLEQQFDPMELSMRSFEESMNKYQW